MDRSYLMLLLPLITVSVECIFFASIHQINSRQPFVVAVVVVLMEVHEFCGFLAGSLTEVEEEAGELFDLFFSPRRAAWR